MGRGFYVEETLLDCGVYRVSLYFLSHINSEGILEQSMGARNRVGIGLPGRPARLHRLAGQSDNSVPSLP
jgi:hypothetical protein